MMIKSLYDITKEALKQYPENALNRKDWLFSYAAQPVLTVDLIQWTLGCTDAITGESEGNQGSVRAYGEFMKQMIVNMVEIVRGQLNTLERTLMGALIVIDVHARDAV